MSSSETDKSQAPDDSSSDGEDVVTYGGPYLPYQHEPLASESASSSESEDGPRERGGRRLAEDEPQDKDGIRPSQLRARFEGTVSLQEW